MSSKYQIMFRSPDLSGNARNYAREYRKVALVEVDPVELAALGLDEPKMISHRAKGMKRIIRCANVYWGKGVRSEGVAYLALLRQEAKLLS